jgi:hypothetical protein
MPECHPISRILELQRPFLHFHTHVIDRQAMDEALHASKSLEVDVCMDQDGHIYVGHPISYYEMRGTSPANNLPLETIIAESKDVGLHLMFDCKDVRVVPLVQETILDYGPERCAIHAFAQELSFDPWPAKTLACAEPHHRGEELPLDSLLALRRATGSPLVLSCHGITTERLQDESDAILRKMASETHGEAAAVSLFLPPDELVPLDFAQRMLDSGIAPVIFSDRTPPPLRPNVYFAFTDTMAEATDPRQFQQN